MIRIVLLSLLLLGCAPTRDIELDVVLKSIELCSSNDNINRIRASNGLDHVIVTCGNGAIFNINDSVDPLIIYK